jgi:outer membrane protein OmpA-like peptidoglycan-associated protein
LPKFAPTDAQLAALGQARANVVKEALLSEGAIDPARVFVATDKAVTAKDGKSRMELAVK